MRDDQPRRERGWLQLQADGTFDPDCVEEGHLEPGTWYIPFRQWGNQTVLLGIPPDEPPAGRRRREGHTHRGS